MGEARPWTPAKKWRIIKRTRTLSSRSVRHLFPFPPVLRASLIQTSGKRDMEKHTEITGPAVTAADIMPPLPGSAPPELSSEDRLVLLLASAAQEHGRLSAEAWSRASEAFSAVFSPNLDLLVSEYARLEAERRFFVLQTRFHAALLHAPFPLSHFQADRRLAADIAALGPEKAALYREAVRSLSAAYAAAAPSSGEATPEEGAAEGRQRGMLHMPSVEGWQLLFKPRQGGEDDSRVVMEGGVAQRKSPRKSILSPTLSAFSAMLSEAGAACTDMAAHAVNQYGGAARYLRELRTQRIFALFSPREEEFAVAVGFEGAEKASLALERAALSAGALDTARALVDLRHLMAEQPFTVVMVGEGKRGKSSLVNALLCGEYSPVREAVPETAAVARFRWGGDFSGTVRFLSEEECARMGAYFASEGKEGVFAERLEELRTGAKERGEQKLLSPEDLRSFLSARERGSIFSARVEVEVPAGILRHGMVLVDTPGLNATDPVQNVLAFEECLAADCLVFVMDARRPESASEEELLRQLARSGRAASVIGVVTGVDRLNEKQSRSEAMARAELLMKSAAAHGMKVLGLVDLNAREAMEQRCAGHAAKEGFQKLCALMEHAASGKKRNAAERGERIRMRGAEIAWAAREEAKKVLERELSRLPDVRHEELLHSHVQRLESVIQSCSTQAWSVASAASVDMDSWRKEQERALDAWQETIVLRIMDAANRHADTLGYTGMFRQKNWKGFDEEEVPRIARESLEELLAGRRDVQKDWNEKLRQFGERMREISVLCLEAVAVEDVDLQSMGEVPFKRERWLVNASSLMKKMGLVAVGLAIRRGGGLGLGIVLGNMGWWAVLPVAVVGSVVWTLMKLGNPSRCRRIFMERKEEAVRKWVKEQRARLEELLNQNMEELTSAYGRAVSEGFVPALAVLAEEASALRTYLDVLGKIRAGVSARAEHTLRLAENLEKSLSLPPGGEAPAGS